MSASRILAQANPLSLVAFPGWKQPTLVRLVANGAGTSVPALVAAKSTPGLSITRSGVGQLNILFPACRDIAGIVANVRNLDPDTPATNMNASIDADATLTSATLGKLRILVFGENDGAAEDLETGDQLDIVFWADLG